MPDRDKQYPQLLIIWVAMVLSLLLYLVVIQTLTPPIPEASSDTTVLETILMSIGAGLVGGSFLVRNYLAARALRTEQDGRIGDLTGSPNTGARSAHGLRMVALVAPLAMCEAAGIFGVVLFFVGETSSYYWFLGVSSLLGMLLHFPRRQS